MSAFGGKADNFVDRSRSGATSIWSGLLAWCVALYTAAQMACCNAVAHFPNYNSIAILRQRVDRRAIRKTGAHEQRWRQPPNIHSLAEFGGEQKFSSAWTARCSDHPHGGPFVNGKGCTWPKAVGFDSIRHSNSRRRNRYWPNRHRISFIGSIRHHPCDRLGDRQVYLRLSAYGPKQT